LNLTGKPGGGPPRPSQFWGNGAQGAPYEKLFRTIIHGPVAHPQIMKNIGGTGF
jgi:hypothetical protein